MSFSQMSHFTQLLTEPCLKLERSVFLHSEVCFFRIPGGTANKMCGRVGDSPLVGSGAYANQQAGAVCTGHGESLLKVLLSRDVVHSVENGMTPHYACRKVISKMAEQTGGHGGVICLDKFGNIGLEFNTRRMVWASVTDEGFLKYGIDPGKEIMSYDAPLKKILK